MKASLPSTGVGAARHDVAGVGAERPGHRLVGTGTVDDTEHHPLALPHRQRGVVGDPRGELDGRLQRVLVLDDFVDQAPSLRLVRAHRLTCERQLHGDLQRDLAWEPDQPTGAREDPPLDLGQPERRPLRCDDEVAHQRDLRSATERESVDRGDHRGGDLVVDEPGEAPLSVAVGERFVTRGRGLEVGTGAERDVSRTGDHDRPDVPVGVGLGQQLAEGGRQGRIDRVADLGPVQRDHGDVALAGHKAAVSCSHEKCTL